jgi:hypothetical protein
LLAQAEAAVRVDPTTISVLQWGRLLDAELFATSRYVDWAVLMKRTFGLSVLACPRCARKMRVLSTLTEPSSVRKILDHLGMRSEPLVAAPARDPTWEQATFGFDAA